MISTDYYPTLLEAAGLSPRPQQHLDGVSFVPLLRGKTRPRRPLYWHYPHYSNQGTWPTGAVRDGKYKLVEDYEDNHDELYDIEADIGEQHDLASAMPEKVAQMRQMLHVWLKSVDAQMPTANPNYVPPKPGAQSSAAPIGPMPLELIDD